MMDFEEIRDADEWPRVLPGDEPPPDYPAGLPFVPNRYVRYKTLSHFSVAVWTLGTPEPVESSVRQARTPEQEPSGKLAELLATAIRVFNSFRDSRVGGNELDDFVTKVVRLACAHSWRVLKGGNTTLERTGMLFLHMERGEERLGIIGHALGKTPFVTAIYHPQGFPGPE